MNVYNARRQPVALGPELGRGGEAVVYKLAVQPALLAVPQGRELLPRRADAHGADADHQLGPVDAYVAPCLERSAAVVGGHRHGREGKTGELRRPLRAKGAAIGKRGQRPFRH